MMTADVPPSPPAIELLAPCPDRPNCVSSLAEDDAHRVEPLPLEGTPEDAISRLREIIEAMPRTTVDEVGPTYLKARFRSRLFGFVDDVEMAVDSDARLIHVRSASRLGYSDHGVNRKRVEAIRARYGKPD